ncbi:MAG: hypothetical protein IT178_19685 [Acidobacteria bacterium]|nr:hypothetical protein [Acidobacteriota bacterium]
MPRFLSGLTLLVLLLCAPLPALAQDLLLMPYLGFTFAGGSSLLADLEGGAGETASAIGASVGLLGNGWWGLEADVAHVPGFFERGERELVLRGSFVTSLTGSALVTLPVRITRESLRPYLVVGGGWLRAEARDAVSSFPIRSTMPVVTAGGGAIGYLSDMVGVRFDLRYLRSLGVGDDVVIQTGPRVRYWRGSVGLVFRY